MLRRTTAAALALALAAGAGSALAQEDDWTTSPWGPDDEIGAANHITPESVRMAAELVTEGKTYPLGIVVDENTPAFAPRSLSVTILQPNQMGTGGLGPTQMTYNDDIFMGWLGIGSQIDALSHLGIDHVYYNGLEGTEIAKASGVTKLGVEKIPPIVARGVLLDMSAHFGQDIVEEGTPYTREDIQAAEEAQGVEIREGDVVLFHSGWLNLLDGSDEARERYVSVEPGLGKTGAEYLIEKGVVAIGADTWGLEVVPFEAGVGVFEVHQMLLAKNGIYILENMDSRELVADGVNEFMFVLGAARVRGAVQMIVNPVAIR
mgnify:CR=1 FL=1